jgi:ATP-binding protein involved in chromosome partitioning
MVDLVEIRPSVYADQVKHALKTVIDPDRKRSIIDLELVSAVKVSGERVAVTLVQRTFERPLSRTLQEEVRRVVMSFPAVRSVEVEILEVPRAREEAQALA